MIGFKSHMMRCVVRGRGGVKEIHGGGLKR